MTTSADFTDEEWARLGRAPVLAGLAITFADPGGPLEALKESSAAMKTIVDASKGNEYGFFVHAIAIDVAERVRHRTNPLADFHASGPDATERILDELRAINELLSSKATPDEADEFRDWVRDAAQAAAKAAREGGFMGFGGVLVSEREQQMLDRLGEAFGQPPS
jgi:hypothetical protein